MGRLEGILGCLDAILGVLEPSLGESGSSWTVLGASWEASGGVVELWSEPREGQSPPGDFSGGRGGCHPEAGGVELSVWGAQGAIIGGRLAHA